jgi:imidazolonepropionase-like amidohydrolase
MRLLALLLLNVAAFSVMGQSPNSIAITHVSIVNVVTGKIDPDQTILIDSNRITAVGPFKKVKLPANATVKDLTGKFLMPGMTDAHIHFFQSGGLYTRPDGMNFSAYYPYEKDQQWIKDNLRQLMNRYLACGITTVADVGGPMSNFAIRDQVNADPLSPNAWVTGPLISTYQPPNLDKKDPPIIKVSSPEEARELVRKQLPSKPDFIKIWYIVMPGQSAESTLPIVKATIEESHAQGLKVAIHATELSTAKLALKNGADILVHSVDDAPADAELLQLLKARPVVYIPTLLVAQNYSRSFTQQFNYSNYELKYADPFMVGTLLDIQHLPKKNQLFDYKKIRSRMPVPSKEDSTMLQNLKQVYQSGALIASGTDAGNIGTHHASSLLPELYAMQQGGMDPLGVLRSTTINAAKGFGKEKDFGSLEKGKMADILILDKNPLEDLKVLENIPQLLHRGKWISTDTLIKSTPELLAQQQLNAYNLRNLEAFLEPYADDVELYSFPNKLEAKGKESMRKSYGPMFTQLKDLHCEVTERIIQGNTVIDHESVAGFGKEKMKAVAIYVIEKGKIAKVYFIE